MPNATVAAVPSLAPSNRRLAGGVLVSLLLHAVVLSLHFGSAGLRPGPGDPLRVQLGPPPDQSIANPLPTLTAVQPASTRPAIPSFASPPPQSVQAALPPALPTSQAHPGFKLLDPESPQPVPAPVPPATVTRRSPRRRARVYAPAGRDGLHSNVIAQNTHKDDAFSVPPALIEPAPEPDPVAQVDAPPASETPPVAPPVQAAEAQPDEQAQEAERVRLAEQREQAREQARETRHQAEEQALRATADADAKRNADEQARALARQEARYEDDLARRQRQADEEKRLAEEAQRQVQARERAAEQARTQQLAEQQRIEAERMRAQQLAEQQRARLLADQREAEARQRQQQAREQAEQSAREQAEQAARLARQEQARRQRDDDAGGLMRAGPVAGVGGAGTGDSGHGGTVPGAPQEGPLIARARELLRGIDIDTPVPPAMRPAQEARRDARRALADAMLRDVPLRMYVDSVRQKIERNAVIGQALLVEGMVRAFPVVSIAIRSDGSVEDVTIVRSSGRPDVDEIVRRVVRLNARYSAFPPNVAANYDVVELRRVWSFSGVLRLLEEMR